MPRPSVPTLAIGAALLLSVLVPDRAPAQMAGIEIDNGGTLQIDNGGVLDLEDDTLSLGSVGSTARLAETNAGRVTGGALRATRELDAPASTDPAGLGAIVTASIDLGAVTIIRGHTVQTGSGNPSIARYYRLAPSQPDTSASGTALTLTYHDAELNGCSENQLALFRSTDGGASWSLTQSTLDTTSVGNNFATRSETLLDGRWTLGSEASPLPVELAQFEGQTTEKGARLRWRTASEQNSAGFEVHRRAVEADESASWSEVGFVASKAEGGTTEEATTYQFVDENLSFAADSLQYRLRQVDTDGGAAVTEPVTLVRSGPQKARLLGTYPNPARQRVTVKFAVPVGAEASSVRLRLYDVLGRRVRTAEAEVEEGRHKRRLDVSGLASGVYFLRLRAGGTVKTRKLTVVR